ncbi:MAG: hypothetical protein ABW022_11035 [Actinoplanes sp.]
MSRIDKSNSAIGNFRAPLNIALTATSGPAGVTDLNRVICVALNGSGRLIKATTAISVVGFILATRAFAAGEMIDVFTNCEVVELDAADIQGATAPTAGTKYYFDATAARLAATAPGAGAIGYYIGTTVEAGRLVVRAGLAGAL